jgi:hypothetical protein
VTYKGIRISGFPAIPFGPKPGEDGERLLDENGSTLLEKLTSETPVDIAIWHGALEEFVPFPMRDSGSMHELPTGYAKAWLLGDIHLRQRKRLDDGVLISYPGTVELCDRGEPAKKFVDYYQLEGDWRSLPFPEPIELELDTRPVVFLTVADEVEADQAVAKIRKVIHDNPGRSPLIFARFSREQRAFVHRVQDIIDPKDTVFRAASFSSNYKGPVQAGEPGGIPIMMNVVDEVLPVGSPCNEVARKLMMPDAQWRHIVTMWVQDALSSDMDDLDDLPTDADRSTARSQDPTPVASDEVPF